MNRFSSLALLALLGLAAPAHAQYGAAQNFNGYVSGLVGPRESPTGVYNQFQRGRSHQLQAVSGRATSYAHNTISLHWSKPAQAHNGATNNLAFTNYVVIALVGTAADSYDASTGDYSTSYVYDLPTPFPAGDGTISAASQLVRSLPYHCPSCGPTSPRQFYVLKSGSYLTNPNDTTATLTNAVVGQRYLITRYDYVADAQGNPTNVNPALFPTFYADGPVAPTVVHATPRITGLVTDPAGHSTVTWAMDVEDPAAQGSGSAPHSYTVRMTEDDSVTTSNVYMAGLAGHRNKPFAADLQYAPPAGYRANLSSPVTASTMPGTASYSYTFDRPTDIVERAGHYYTFQVTSNDYSLGPNSDDSPASAPVDPVYNPQPLELTNFTASRAGQLAGGVQLSWTTARESNSYLFEVQRSLDGGQSWTNVQTVAGAGTSTTTQYYQVADVSSATSAYRLVQGSPSHATLTYSWTVTAPAAVLATSAGQAASPLSVYPNPALGRRVHFGGLDPALPVSLRNPLGQVVRQLPAGVSGADFSTLAPGLYLLQQGSQVLRLVLP